MRGFPFVVSYWNCAAGLLCKWDFVQLYVEEHKPDILFIAESEIPSNANLNFPKIEGYRTEYSNTISTRNKARLICFCKPFFDRKSDLENNLNEIIVLKHKSSIICGIYRPFECFENESQMSNFNQFVSNLESVATYSANMSKLFTGDFNVHLDNDNCKMRQNLEAWEDKWFLPQCS